MAFPHAVLQVIPALDAGGAERTTVEMTRAIVDAGGRALVATSGGWLARDVEEAGGTIAHMPVASKNPATIIANRGRLVRLVRAERIDLVHARSRAPAWSALTAARAAGIPYVATWHGAYDDASAIKRFYNSGLARADLVIANSQFTAERIRAHYDVGDRLRIIPRGADLDLFNPDGVADARLAALRAEWRLPADRQGLTLLLPARLAGWKGHRVAVEAMALLYGQSDTGGTDDFRLIFAGDSQGRDEFARSLLRWVNELGLSSMIRLVGPCDDMPAAYAISDIVLAPSTRPEAFGRVAAEAGAMRKPAIASDHGGARETIADGETGLLVTPGSAEALAAAILKLKAIGSDGRRAMGERARARIVKHYSIKVMTDATLAAYQSLLAWRRAA